jgi:benzylsuccinate CoA-transferase BbsE subunit
MGTGHRGALAGLTILEVAGPYGDYTGKQLADLGADVVVVEHPAGAPRRAAGPFVDDEPGLDRSLTFAYFNAGKRSVALDLTHADGAALFRRLAVDADVVIDGTGSPTAMVERGLGYDTLADDNPRLVYTMITPFGRSGPYADWQATDIVLMAMGGLLSLGGYRDGIPVRAYGDQAILAAAQFASVATMIAVLQAEETGLGQLVDVSAQESVVMAHENAVQFYDLAHVVRRRNGGSPRQAGVGVYPCIDGHVYLLATGLGVFWPQLVAWLEEEGIEGASGLHDDKWQDNAFAASEEGKAEFQVIFDRLAMQRTKAELYDAAKRMRLPLCPVNSPADLAESPQLNARNYFVEVKDPTSGRVLRMPGVPYRFDGATPPDPSPAPRIGEHTHDVLAALGLDADDVARLAETGATR